MAAARRSKVTSLYEAQYQDNPLDQLPAVTSPEQVEPAGFLEGAAARFRFTLDEETSISQIRALQPYLDKRRSAIEKVAGKPVPWFIDYGIAPNSEIFRDYSDMVGAGEITVDDDGKITASTERARRATMSGPRGGPYQKLASMAYAWRLHRDHPDQVPSDFEIMQQMSGEFAQRRHQNLGVASRAGPLANFLGSASGLMADPVVLATMPLGYGWIEGGSILANAAKGFASEFVIGAASEAVIQSEVYDFKRSIQSPYTKAEAIMNVVAAGTGAGVVRATAGAGIDLGVAVIKAATTKQIAERLVAEGIDPAVAKAIGEEIVRREETRPPAVAPEAHSEAVDTAVAQADEGLLADVEHVVPASQFMPGGRMAEADTLESFTPDQLLVDPERFQFKSGTDQSGVVTSAETTAATTFDRRLSGKVLVYEDHDGKLYIADGHQRLGIARRALAGGQAPESVLLDGFRLRAADGVTPAEARVWAGVKNIAEGSARPMDAAKVFRELGEGGFEALGLPPISPRSALARHGKALAKLSDDAFQAVVNDLIPERYGAIVGEMIHGGDRQLAAIKVLARAEPANEVQARAIVEQVRQAGFTESTHDLFGAVAESLVVERARVLDAAVSRLRKDRATFNTLIQREGAIAQAGNVLAKEANRAIVEDSDRLITELTRLANTDPRISDALNAAARAVKAGKSPKLAVVGLLESLRGANPEGGVGRPAAGVAGSQGEVPGAERFGPDDVDPEVSPVNPVTRDATPEQKAAELVALGEENRALVEPIVAEIDKALGTTSEVSVKSAEGLVTKVTRDDVKALRPWFGVEHIRDSFRFRSAVDTIDDIGTAVNMLLDRIPGAQLIKVDVEKMTRPGAWGWRMVAFDLRMPNGQLAEYYLTYRGVLDVNKGKGHELFERWRNRSQAGLTPAERAQRLADMDESSAAYAAAFEAGLAGEGLDESAARASLTSLADSLGSRTGSKESSSASSVTAPKVADERQVPPSRTANISAVDTTTQSPGGLAENTSKGMTTSSESIPRGQADAFGDSTKSAQAIADLQRIKDAARNTGQDSLETGDPSDLFSQARQQLDLADVEIAIGTRPDGSIETRSAREALDEIQKEIDGVKAVDTCLTGKRT